ncbi:MAG: prepilin-type N-terminal cleavage/methylation domain-containing protein [Candidatus Saccharibacteria bacterium]|nr:prepilin-type N-terminal cleavage/methylation domain-containing protein [Candidatus Saccharibacteria bacterium]
MGIVPEKELKGFTIIEVMLFLALSGFLLAGILAGTGSSIANQRYKDAVQDATDALRSAFAFVADTQIETRSNGEGACGGTVDGFNDVSAGDNTLRGRTSCAVYGAVVMIDGPLIQTTTVIGRDYFDFIRAAYDASVSNSSISNDLATVLNPANDLELLKALHVNNLAYHCPTAGSCKDVAVAGGVKQQKLKWDTSFKAPRGEEDNKNEDLKLTLLIYRSPVNGSIRTISMDRVITNNDGSTVDYSNESSLYSLSSQGIYQFFGKNQNNTPYMTQKNIYLCVDSNGADSYAEHRRIIKIAKNAHSQSGVILLDMDAEVYENGQEVLCDDK